MGLRTTHGGEGEEHGPWLRRKIDQGLVCLLWPGTFKNFQTTPLWLLYLTNQRLEIFEGNQGVRILVL